MDQAPYWSSNETALRRSHAQHAALLATLQTVQATTDFQLCNTPAGDYTLHYEGGFLHSPQGAMQEAAEAVLNQCQPGLGRAHLLMGLGLGYVLDTLYQHTPGQIVVYEPDLPLLKFILENVNLADAWASGRVQLVTHIPEVLNALRPLVVGENPLDVILVPGEAQRLHRDIPPLMAQLVDMVEERIRDFRTGQHFHRQWIRQFFQNLPHFAQTTPFEAIAPTFANKPALIIGRGPSLDAALDDIHAMADGMTLIAAGSALHALYQAGITPDMAVFYDPNGVKEQLHGLPDSYLRQIIFCISAFTDPLAFAAPNRAKILFYPQSGEAFAHWLAAECPEVSECKVLSQPLLLEGGGTVSVVAMQLALALHSSSITLIGQDLAFPNQQVYAGGIALQQDENGRLALPQSETLFTAPEAMTTVLGQNHENLPALKAYTGFIRHFERLAEANAQSNQPISLFNASIGGAAIAGYTLKPLRDFRDTDAPFLRDFSSAPDGRSTESANVLEALRFAVTRLQGDLHACVRLHEATLAINENTPEPLNQMPITTTSQPNQALFAFLNQHPLIAHFLLFEMITVQQRYRLEPNNPAAIEANQTLLNQSTMQCIALLREEILPMVIQAQQTLEAQRHATAPKAVQQRT